jgi:hypothetical protein
MEFTDGVADHAGRLLEAATRLQPKLAHGMEQPAMHRLEAIARVRQRPVHDGRQRIGEVALLERFAQCDLLDLGGFGWNQSLAHASR